MSQQTRVNASAWAVPILGLEPSQEELLLALGLPAVCECPLLLSSGCLNAPEDCDKVLHHLYWHRCTQGAHHSEAEALLIRIALAGGQW